MHRPRSLVATGLAAALAGTVLAAPAAAQEASPTDVSPDNVSDGEAPPDAPPPAEPPPDVPPDVPGDDTPAVRSGYAVDVEAPPSTELPAGAAPGAGTDAPPPAEPTPEPPSGVPSATDTPAASDEHDGPPREDRRASRRGRGDERAATPSARVPQASSTSVTPGAPPPVEAPADEHTVSAGEHLWSIAAARVATASGRAPGDVPAEEVAPYWTQLCMLNAERLRSGDLNLVYPGEVLTLPPG